jgi:hypothetical protein
MAKPREPKSSTKEPIVGDSQATAESQRIGVTIHPDSSYDETTPINADASGMIGPTNPMPPRKKNAGK